YLGGHVPHPALLRAEGAPPGTRRGRVGRMTAQGCVRWQGELAMQALGKLEPDAATALQAHLDGCAACREEAAELAPLAAALAAASPDVFDDPEAAPVPARLQQSVLARLDAEAQSEHRRARRRGGAAVAAV